MRWAVLLLLAGCQAPVTIDRPVRVDVPVPVACITSLPVRPLTTPDAELKTLDDYRLVLTIWRDLLILRDYSAALEALLAPCAATPGPQPKTDHGSPQTQALPPIPVLHDVRAVVVDGQQGRSLRHAVPQANRGGQADQGREESP